MRPVLFFAFANDRDEHLATLKDESRSLKKILRPLEQKDVVKLEFQENSDIHDIYETCIHYGEQTMLFHFGGHANGTHLRLEGKTADGSGLAELFGANKNAIKLVFLNGCSTKNQVEQLLKCGVEAVIATRSAISDPLATQFAKLFYQSLVQNNTLEQAFNKAASFLKSYSESANIYRDIVIDDFHQISSSNEIPWGLYIHPDSEDILSWKLPRFKTINLNKSDNSSGGFIVNRCFDNILNEMKKYEPNVQNDLANLDRSEYLNTIIERFPYPIAIQFQKLVSSDLKKMNIDRLRQIVSTYTLTSKLLYLILLSQLWEEQHESTADLRISLSGFYAINHDDHLGFPYAMAANEVFIELSRLGKSVFLEEYKTLYNKFQGENGLGVACSYLENLKTLIDTDISGENCLDYCKQGELYLSEYLTSAAFLVRYDFYGIRDVYLYKPRYESELYKHRYSLLKLSLQNNISIRDETKDSFFFTENNSILLIEKDNETLDRYLNLSPFLIDKNAFSSLNDSEIFMFAYQDKDELVYHRVNSSTYKAQIDPDDQIKIPLAIQTEESVYFNLIQHQVSVFHTDFNLS